MRYLSILIIFIGCGDEPIPEDVIKELNRQELLNAIEQCNRERDSLVEQLIRK